MKMEVIREGVLKAKENVEHLDPRKIILDRWWLQGSAEELSKSTDGVQRGW